MPTELPVVLITGASTGIGLALLRRLRTLPYRVVATAREASLTRFTDAGFVDDDRLLIRPLDVTNAGQREALVAELTRTWRGIDVLVNNAGISYRAVVEEMGEAEELKQLQVNYLGPMALIRLVLPTMRAKRTGRIMNISSVGGMMAMPTMAAYCASKFALEGASEALWYELRPWGIRVSIVEPGFVHSGAFKRVYYAARSAQGRGTPPYQIYYAAMTPFIARLMRWSWTTPDRVARTIVRTLRRSDPPLRVPATIDATLFFWLRRLLPRWLYHRVLYAGLPGARWWVRSRGVS